MKTHPTTSSWNLFAGYSLDSILHNETHLPDTCPDRTPVDVCSKDLGRDWISKDSCSPRALLDDHRENVSLNLKLGRNGDQEVTRMEEVRMVVVYWYGD